MLSGKRIVLGVTGGIAAYKAVFLLREYQKAGAEVRVTMTPSATRFVGLDTFASLSGHSVAVEIFPDEVDSSEWTRHIYWGEWADLFVIAPGRSSQSLFACVFCPVQTNGQGLQKSGIYVTESHKTFQYPPQLLFSLP